MEPLFSVDYIDKAQVEVESTCTSRAKALYYFYDIYIFFIFCNVFGKNSQLIFKLSLYLIKQAHI